jgi:pimeloyl-ACP methyl ester carboxylesterase
MPLTPFAAIGIWLRGLLSLAILGGGAWLLRSWYVDCNVWVPELVTIVGATPDAAGVDGPVLVGGETARPGHREFRFHPGFNRPTAELAGALALLTWGLFGLPIAKGIARLVLKEGVDEPKRERGGEVRRVVRPDGTELHVEIYGPPDAPPIILTHGWGADATEWYYEKERLAGRFRLIVWDLPGLGHSKGPEDGNFSLEKLAGDLEAVLALAGERPAILLGHSIGGMITLTFCRVFPEALRTRVAGLVLVHTTYKNPVRTMKGASWKTALEGPVLIPSLHLMIATWPVVWAMNWLTYLRGSFHQQTHSDSFAGTETRGQLDFAASFLPRARPDVIARGMFGMLRYDATATLATIGVPTLVVAADRDVTTLPEASRTMADGIPGATLEVLAPGRHMGLVERNERFDAVVADFVSACLAAPAPGAPAV